MSLLDILKSAVLLAALGIPVCANAETIERIAAVAGDEVITVNDIRKEGALRYAVKGKDLRDIDESDEAELEKITKELVQTRLISRQARKNSIHIGDREVDMQLQQMYRQSGQSEDVYKSMMAQEGISWEAYRAYIRSEIETQYVVRSELAGQVSAPESDVIACAQEKAPNAENSITATLRQILIPELKADSEAGLSSPNARVLNGVWWNNLDAAMKQYAEGVQSVVAKDPEHFLDYVAKYSTGRSVERGGLLGSFSPGDLSKDFAPVFVLSAGQVSSLINTAVGYHIIYVEDVVIGESEAWKKAMDSCREILAMRESQRLMESWLSDLLQKNFVSILVNKDISDVE